MGTSIPDSSQTEIRLGTDSPRKPRPCQKLQAGRQTTIAGAALETSGAEQHASISRCREARPARLWMISLAQLPSLAYGYPRPDTCLRFIFIYMPDAAEREAGSTRSDASLLTARWRHGSRCRTARRCRLIAVDGKRSGQTDAQLLESVP